MDLEGKSALTRTHGSETESKDRHDHLKHTVNPIEGPYGINLQTVISRVVSIVILVVAAAHGTALAEEESTTTTVGSTVPVAIDTTTTPVVDLPLPRESGSGRRAVYSIRQQHVWVVNGDDEVIRRFPVSGMRGQPKPGKYSVFSQSLTSFSPELQGVTFRYMTRFAIGRNGGNIGFHEIPLRNGKPMQTVEQLGTFRGSGCLRSSTEDARFMYAWAKPGTTVVVVP
jgi:lipoprotein-anchoring transpeptidase ErfK/SrfK